MGIKHPRVDLKELFERLKSYVGVVSYFVMLNQASKFRLSASCSIAVHIMAVSLQLWSLGIDLIIIFFLLFSAYSL